MGKIIGIDLGTTNSLVAVWQDGESRLIPNAFGEYLTPSVVSIEEEGTVYVGKTAKEQLASHPEDTASVFKRYMGTAKKYRLGKKEYRPEELSSFVLKKLKEDAERYLGEPVEEAIISVPAYFNDMGRNATKRAGLLAGLKVERIINEPSAAALACQNRKQEEDATILVFDFGGGTLDVSVVECFDNVIEILAVSGDNQLGGQDFDDAIVKYFLRHCEIDPKNLTAQTRAILRSSAEKCKKELTEKTSAEMVVRCEQIDRKLEITRKQLVEAAAELFERMGRPVRQALMDAEIEVEDLNQIVLVGGSCKMPVVRQYLQHLFKRKDLQTLNPDHMIALGAGVCAGIKERDEEIKDMLLTDICPFSLGTGIVNYNEPGRDRMSVIIPRNSALPCSRTHIYCTVCDNQSEICFEVYQGEAMHVEDNMWLGKLSFEIPERPRGEVYCEVTYTYDINGVLEVDVYVPATKEKKQLVIVNKDLGMTQEQIKAKLKEYEKLKLSPLEQEENKYVLAWAERLFMQCNSGMRKEIENRRAYFIHVLRDDPDHAIKARKYLMVFLAATEKMMENYINWDEESWESGEWYQEDEEQQEMEDLFQEWDNK